MSSSIKGSNPQELAKVMSWGERWEVAYKFLRDTLGYTHFQALAALGPRPEVVVREK